MNRKCADSPAKPEAENLAFPSTRVLAMLTAVMGNGAGPEDALQLWLETARMVNALQSLPSENRNAVLNMIGRKFRLDDGFEQNKKGDVPNDLTTALNRATVMKSVPDAMKELGIITQKTFGALLRYTWLGACKETSAEQEQSLRQKTLDVQDHGIDEDLMRRLRLAQRERKRMAAKKNSANARHKRKKRNTV